MMRSVSRFTVLACAAFGLAALGASDADAGTSGRFGYGPVGQFGGYARATPFGRRHAFHGRIGRYGGAPLAAFGYPGASYHEPPVEPTSSNVNANLSINARSVVIHRGPAFGEPGYYSQPVIYRLSQEPARTPGTRRFRVDKLQF